MIEILLALLGCSVVVGSVSYRIGYRRGGRAIADAVRDEIQTITK